jgi:retron-type reverse transcriptase
MGDAQRSQTISTEFQRIAEQTACDSEEMFGNGNPPILVGENSFGKLGMLAENNPDMVSASLAHRINLSLLRDSFRLVRKNESAGVDGVTAKEYAENLDKNLYNLWERLRRGQFVATPVKRIWLEKENGEKRPIGIPAPEDKIVRKAVETIPDVIYDVDFYDFSYGFRKGRSQHEALHELREQCIKPDINWIADADVSGFFDNTDHKLLQALWKDSFFQRA